MALQALARELKPEHITGTVIIVPAANAPAVRAGARVSPLDGGNLNRSYPGSARGAPTAQVAEFISRQLLPRADVALDLHSGGNNSVYVDAAFVYRGPTEQLWQTKSQIAQRLGLPYVIVVAEKFEPGSINSAGDDAGIPIVSTELAGGGTVNRRTLADIRRGLHRFLTDQGILRDGAELAILGGAELQALAASSPRAGEVTSAGAADADRPAQQWLELVAESGIPAEIPGFVEPLVDLGDEVRKGETVALVYSIDEPQRDPVGHRAELDGVVTVVRRPTLVLRGSFVMHIARRIDAPAELS
ncbi:N-alpha-acetyl-L-2,4-diaminobutyrate deacetylase [Brevibacterium iodinum ATCC 49514]|uniref:N-alpha-acetyl-L-2,4-diaminobutyrate deacetylase n=1 Tax=Brevibacterium iodinum ATCC 49514 TaxID=1255616 RepID=A0A2H1HXZ6_9MICO|nr:succinylglutamate desuccinylase/aspartoacylase family protein [Brevibacterium iodinum]SMX67706.1 N-alpha-acetyl-L-2,4-diaminobutyrate deacetylase [Brevibacterium iodinum ATCC 49514]SUW13766.1 ectoine utilization protein EutE [Brevibacterium iodinum]